MTYLPTYRSYRLYRSSAQQGFGLIEIVIVTAIFGVVLVAFLQGGIFAVRVLREEKETLEATMLAQEGMEIVRGVRDESWTNNIVPLINGTIYYPVMLNSKWTLSVNNPGLINGRYTRYVTFDQVLRDSNDDIASSGAVDANTRKVTVAILWNNKQRQLLTYLTNFSAQLAAAVEFKAISEGASTDADIINFPSLNAGDGDPAQSFTTLTSALNVTRVDLLLRRTTSAPSDIYAEIRTGPLGTILGASQLINTSSIATSSAAWVEFRFAREIPLAASTLYYIRLRSTPSSTAVGSGSKGSLHWLYLQTASPGPYGGGTAHRYIEHLGNPADIGQQLDQYDFGFKVYALQ